MKKTGLAAIAFVLLMSCNMGANDGDVDTDTTTFPSETIDRADTTGFSSSPDSNNRILDSLTSNTASPPSSRSTTPGAQNNGGSMGNQSNQNTQNNQKNKNYPANQSNNQMP